MKSSVFRIIGIVVLACALVGEAPAQTIEKRVLSIGDPARIAGASAFK